MKIRNVYLTFAILAISMMASAVVYHDRAASCYLFKDNKLLKKGVCLISSESGYGELHIELSFEGKSYKIYENGRNDPTITKLNNIRAKGYYRDPRYHNIIMPKPEDEEIMYCHKSKDIDICYADFIQNF